ncbi:MAG: DUF1211 domain-containing protein [Bacteroidetes bacterium]|nr:DUF1211 domain-containing protein [Bacteroidota bacterium]
MKPETKIPVTRIEAFSDGVIAIIITVMVFDLKLPEIAGSQQLIREFTGLLPKLFSYLLSFVFLSIMWMNHHQLFHHISHSTRTLIWYNMFLLFGMSLVPFGTSFVGTNPGMWQAYTLYGLIFSMCVLAFILLRKYLINNDLTKHPHSRILHLKINRKNYLALSLYLTASAVAFLSIYASLVLLLLVPAMYVLNNGGDNSKNVAH